ncbi:MAG: 3-keto-disaccharide hydrolase [Saprospiraceae bacterium]
MKSFLRVVTLWSASILTLQAQITDPKATEVWTPEPRLVTPGEGTQAPSDAIVLFDGKKLDEWLSAKDSSAAKWEISEGAMTVKPGTGDMITKRNFSDFQLHLEFATPEIVKGEGQGRGNSGIFLQNRYEVQVLDCYQNRTYSNGQTGAIYKQSIPLVNACRKPGAWQTYEILYTAPRFNQDGILLTPAYVTVLHNGILIQNHVAVKGTTEYIGLPKNEAHGKGPLKLQDHGDLVRYRNIWVREL